MARRGLTLTPEHVATYAILTGDYNPLHFDPEFVARTRFGKLVVQGGLTTGLAALPWWRWDLPGAGHGLPEPELEVHAPVYIAATRSRLKPEFVSVLTKPKPVCQLAIAVTRQTGETGAGRRGLVLQRSQRDRDYRAPA